MIYCFDIDGTLCSKTNGQYDQARPYQDAIVKMNTLYEAGHRIILFTARGTTTGIDWRELTEEQLQAWGAKYHDLIFGKPEADVFVDDKSMGPATWREIGLSPETFSLDEEPSTDKSSVLNNPAYLNVTYSPDRAPATDYPHLLAQWLLKNVYHKSGRLLDIGCGRGDHMHAFSRLGFEVSGVDISPISASSQQCGTVRIADLESEPLPFPPRSFDCIFSKSVIEHMRNPSQLLSKSLEALRPGGIAVIMTPSWEHTFWGPFYIDHTHVTPFTAPSLQDALEIVGFDDPRVFHFYQLPFLWRYPFLKPIAWTIACLPLPYRPYRKAPWPDSVNKLIRFSKELMLLGIATSPLNR